MLWRLTIALLGMALFAKARFAEAVSAEWTYRWLNAPAIETLESRIRPPFGYQRKPTNPTTFAHWLRTFPVKPAGHSVRLFNGQLKSNQSVHWAVLDLDLEDQDLQQCADTIIRLRAEYLFASGCEKSIHFKFTSGDEASWNDWKNGRRPQIKGNKVTWVKMGNHDGSYRNFRKYLETVFRYAGTASLAGELHPVADRSSLSAGDVFIQGGYPGHAVLVMDTVENSTQERKFLLAQSYMPAQEAHILRNPKSSTGPWYDVSNASTLETPEWQFDFTHLRRFSDVDCRPGPNL